MTRLVLKHKGNKENIKDRKDRKPKFSLKDMECSKKWRNKTFPEYSDIIERVTYNDETFKSLKEVYDTFLNKEIVFYRKITKLLDGYNSKLSGANRSLTKNQELFDFYNQSTKIINKIIEEKTKKQEEVKKFNENEFWNLFTPIIKEKLICCNSLKAEKLDIIIMGNELERNLQLFKIVEKVKLQFGFKENEKDLNQFYNLFKKCGKEFKYPDLLSEIGTTDMSDNSQEEYESEELEYSELISVSDCIKNDNKTFLGKKKQRQTNINQILEDDVKIQNKMNKILDDIKEFDELNDFVESYNNYLLKEGKIVNNIEITSEMKKKYS